MSLFTTHNYGFTIDLKKTIDKDIRDKLGLKSAYTETGEQLILISEEIHNDQGLYHGLIQKCDWLENGLNIDKEETDKRLKDKLAKLNSELNLNIEWQEPHIFSYSTDLEHI